MPSNRLNPEAIKFLEELENYYGHHNGGGYDFSRNFTEKELNEMPPVIAGILKADNFNDALVNALEEFKIEINNADDLGLSDNEVKSLKKIHAQGQNYLENHSSFLDDNHISNESDPVANNDSSNMPSDANELVLVNGLEDSNESLHNAEFKDIDDSGRNILHFGPFEDLAQKIGGNLSMLSEDPTCTRISNYFISFSRDKLNDLVMESPGVMNQDDTAFEHRLELLNKFKNQINKEHKKVFEKYSPEQVSKLGMYTSTINNLIDTEIKKNLIIINSPKEQLTSAELFIKRIFGSSQKDVLGDMQKLRMSREAAVDKKLDQLAKIARKFRDHAGDSLWESTEGVKLAKEAKSLGKSTKQILEKVMGTVDERGFGKKFAAISQSLKDSSNNVVDAALKARLQKISEAMTAFVERILNKIGIRRAPAP